MWSSFMKQKYFGVSLCLLIFTAGFVAAFSTGPPDGLTGAPGEVTCALNSPCHGSFTLNSGDGVVTLTAPTTYDPNGGTVNINIGIAQTGQTRWGFEATMLDANDNFVGFFMDDDPNRTQISTTNGREYIKHVFSGTDAGTANASLGWNIHWVSPSNFGPVTLYVAVNAANNNGGGTGDYIYTDTITINPDISNCCIAARGNVDGGVDDGTLSGSVDIADLVYLVSFMFQDGPAPPCPDEANIDGSTGLIVIDIADLVGLVSFMFQNGPDPAPCP